MEHQNPNFGPIHSSPGEPFVPQEEDYGGYDNRQYRQNNRGRFSGSHSGGPYHPRPQQGGWRWGGPGPRSADNYHQQFSYQSPNQMDGRHQRHFQSPPLYSSTPRKPFHHNQRRGNFHQQRNQGPRFHGNTQSGGKTTDNIENWISSRMWEDPWIHLLPSAAVSDSKLPDTEKDVDVNPETMHSDLLDTSDTTEYYSALDTSALNTTSNTTSELDDSIGAEDANSEPAINLPKMLESEVRDEQNPIPS